MRIVVAAIVMVFAAGGCTGGERPLTTASPSTVATASADAGLAAFLLTEADVPAGYRRFELPSLPEGSAGSCKSLSLKGSGADAGSEAKVSFTGPATGSFISEVLRRAAEADAGRALDDLAAAPRDCATFTAETMGIKLAFTLSGLSFPALGRRTVAVRMTATATGLPLVVDEILVAVWTGRLLVVVSVVGQNSVDAATAEAVTRKAWERAATA